MPKLRYIIALGMILLWAASPVLACLPNPQMTSAEMECCKKMAGDCQMGNAQHPCCKTVSSAPTQAALVRVQPAAHAPANVAVIATVRFDQTSLTAEGSSQQMLLGLPPPAPPGSNSILRI